MKFCKNYASYRSLSLDFLSLSLVSTLVFESFPVVFKNNPLESITVPAASDSKK